MSAKTKEMTMWANYDTQKPVVGEELTQGELTHTEINTYLNVLCQ